MGARCGWPSVRSRPGGTLRNLASTSKRPTAAATRLRGSLAMRETPSVRHAEPTGPPRRAGRAGNGEHPRIGDPALQSLLAAIPAAIYTTDAAGYITYYNQAAAK